jgi:hypothetical protein
VTLFKLAATALTSGAVFAMSTATVFAMGGRGGRPEVGPGSASFSARPSISSSGASAGGAHTPPSNVASVPEIDASTGLLALAAVLAIVAFAWERNRRARA